MQLTAEAILAVFDAYYAEYSRLAWAAKEAFENRDPATSLTVARRRLTIYSETIHQVARRLTRVLPELTADEPLWRRIEAAYAPLTAGRYEQDLALAYIHSARRLLFQDEWTPVEYSFGTAGQTEQRQIAVHRVFPGGATITPELVIAILRAPDFNKPFQDIELDATMVAERANRDYGFDGGEQRAFQADSDDQVGLLPQSRRLYRGAHHHEGLQLPPLRAVAGKPYTGHFRRRGADQRGRRP